MADTSVVGSVLTWLEAQPAVDSKTVGLEVAPPEGEDGFTLSSIPGEPYITRYKSGGYVAEYPFSVVLRINNPDTDGRIAATSALGDIAASIDEGRSAWPVAPEGFMYQRLEVRTLPARAATDSSGAEDYQVTFTLTYRKRG